MKTSSYFNFDFIPSFQKAETLKQLNKEKLSISSLSLSCSYEGKRVISKMIVMDQNIFSKKSSSFYLLLT